MKVSLEGLLCNAERSLRSSRDPHACMQAYVLMELGDNLRMVARGEATIEEFFALYVVDVADREPLAPQVDRRKFACMQVQEDAE